MKNEKEPDGWIDTTPARRYAFVAFTASPRLGILGKTCKTIRAGGRNVLIEFDDGRQAITERWCLGSLS